jgi:pre-mRNA 3'-end-processing factor FIP1
LDADFPGEDDKPWRRPGSDVNDYFNYGFDEFTWASYCLKQQELRKEVTDQKKQLEEMQAFLGMAAGALPGLPNAPTPPVPGTGTPVTGVGPGGSTPGPQQGGGGQPSMPGMQGGVPEMSQEMMQGMLASMMAQGLDPASMDPMAFMQHAQAMMGGAQPGPGGAPGGQPGFGGQQQMGYGGYDQRGGGFVGAGRGKIPGRRW